MKEMLQFVYVSIIPVMLGLYLLVYDGTDIIYLLTSKTFNSIEKVNIDKTSWINK